MKYNVVRITFPPESGKVVQFNRVEYRVEYKPNWWPLWWFHVIEYDQHGLRRDVDFKTEEKAVQYVKDQLKAKENRDNYKPVRDIVHWYGYSRKL